jgi:prolyl-tRNA synthetase
MILTKQSDVFVKTRKEDPHAEQSKNASLLIRAGFIHKEMAGVYAYLPLGLRVLNKLKTIIREEMDSIGGQELAMTTLQSKELWEKTDRWDDDKVDVWFKSELNAGGEVGFGWSHEEPIANMMRGYISSFRDLPIFVYQFQNKLRNELRAKSGIMRGREFLMKDMYSFCIGEKDHTEFYNQVIESYKNVFKRVGIGDDTFVTFASGGAFTKFSHEFQTITENGEDVTFINREKNIAVNAEVLEDGTLKELGITREELEEVKTAEVGNIFNFGTQKSEDLGLHFKNEEGNEIPVWMGSYGIGVTRLMGVLVEKMSDDKGIVWPESASPYDAHIVLIPGSDDTAVKADSIAKAISEKVDVLYDDRDVRAGEKFADSDLIGIPYRIIVSDRGLADDNVEIKRRSDGKVVVVSVNELLARSFTELFS